jgi:Flp pilus assembly protein TadD
MKWFGGLLGRREPVVARARRLVEDNELGAAIALLKPHLVQFPGDAEARRVVAAAQLRNGNYAQAEQQLRLAIDAEPPNVGVVLDLASLLKRQERWNDLAAVIEARLGRFSATPAVLNELGVALWLSGELARAEVVLREALTMSPDDAAIRVNLAQLLTAAAHFDAAESVLRPCLQRPPILLQARYTEALLLHDAGRLSEAEAALRALVRDHPDCAEAQHLLACLLLARGDFAKAWPHYRKRDTVSPAFHAFRAPEWTDQDLRGCRVLVYAEQGIGDEILFASCLHDLQLAAGEVIVECDERLLVLYRRAFPGVRFFRRGRGVERRVPEELAPIDVQVSLGELGARFRTSLAAFDGASSYLRADPERVQYWRARLDSLGSVPKIGFAWRGGTSATRAELRSIDAKLWRPILSARDAVWVSVQYGDTTQDLSVFREFASGQLVELADARANQVELAALLCALDLVVSVTTSVLNLAGALGRPTWALVPRLAEWPYCGVPGGTPWFPSVRVFQQEDLGRWEQVVAQVGGELLRWKAEN